jgi:hypothetical protein
MLVMYEVIADEGSKRPNQQLLNIESSGAHKRRKFLYLVIANSNVFSLDKRPRECILQGRITKC